MSTNIDSNGSLTITTTTGDKSTFTFNEHSDVILDNPVRKSGGRALVTGHDDCLVINYANDFTGGVVVNGLSLAGVNAKDLPTAPGGVNTFDIVMDASGKLYKKD